MEPLISVDLRNISYRLISTMYKKVHVIVRFSVGEDFEFSLEGNIHTA